MYMKNEKVNGLRQSIMIFCRFTSPYRRILEWLDQAEAQMHHRFLRHNLRCAGGDDLRRCSYLERRKEIKSRTIRRGIGSNSRARVDRGDSGVRDNRATEFRSRVPARYPPLDAGNAGEYRIAGGSQG